MTQKLRTAVLVVHGIGSQRPLETVRGVINAVWFDHDDHHRDKKKIWSHPEPGGVDLDLTVMTTSRVEDSADKRSVDFHELYWAHMMSETKAVAVLLWLFELARKGPRLKPGMNGLWWVAAIFLCLLLLSTSLLTLKVIVWFSEIALMPQVVLLAPYVMVFIAVFFGLWVTARYDAPQLLALLKKVLVWLCLPIVVVAATAAILWWCGVPGAKILFILNICIEWMTNVLLPAGIALLAAFLLMGKWGLSAFWRAYGLSLLFLAIYLAAVAIEILFTGGTLGQAYSKVVGIVAAAQLPWSLLSKASTVCAWVIIGVYLIVNAAFLQPYLGDAARYFRNSPANVAVRRKIRKEAVDTLDSLHASGFYDRIIVVAHSLGCVVSYDMLRAYYSRICDSIPVTKSLNPEFDRINGGKLTLAQLRQQARVLVGKIAKSHKQPATMERGRVSGQGPHAWLVTDFVTLGNALTHAHYLMCVGDTVGKLNQDFVRRVDEREFPTCPPKQAGPDGWLAFTNPYTKKPQLHHGGLFALTRWTNIYFPLQQIFWGDAIGGPVGTKGSVFGPYIEDIEVSTDAAKTAGFFTHTKYWDTTFKAGRAAPHIEALRAAIDLEDKP